MQTKKIITLSVSLLVLFCCVHFASAQGYTPLVRIPGLPATGEVNLSMYLVGIYNFLLSIVGIVAVMMLIVGGMRYITAAGNSAAIGDAKDIIQNAIVGLLLALLSWVFIATINPDVLYIKKPTLTAYNVYNPKCTVSAADANPCLCVNGEIVSLNTGSTCNKTCDKEGKCNPQKPISCITEGINNIGDVTKGCVCADKTEIAAGEKKEARISFTITDTNPAVGDTIILTAVLTDAETVSHLVGKKIIFISVNNNLHGSTSTILSTPSLLSTDGSGEVMHNLTVNCSATEQFQAIFVGESDDDYASVGSDIITVVITGALLCNLNNYPIKPALQFWEGPVHSCQNYCRDNCGKQFLYLKMNPSGNWEDIDGVGPIDYDEDIFILDSDTELWNFSLTNDGTIGVFDVTAKFYEPAAGEFYFCAILMTRESFGPDHSHVFWIKRGVSIKTEGESLRKDIVSSGLVKPFWSCCGGGPACNLSGFNLCATTGYSVLNAQYTKPVGSRCGDCSFSLGNKFRPEYDITCKIDSNGVGAWIKQ